MECKSGAVSAFNLKNKCHWYTVKIIENAFEF